MKKVIALLLLSVMMAGCGTAQFTDEEVIALKSLVADKVQSASSENGEKASEKSAQSKEFDKTDMVGEFVGELYPIIHYDVDTGESTKGDTPISVILVINSDGTWYLTRGGYSDEGVWAYKTDSGKNIGLYKEDVNGNTIGTFSNVNGRLLLSMTAGLGDEDVEMTKQ